jgi:hypothetical protein
MIGRSVSASAPSEADDQALSLWTETFARVFDAWSPLPTASGSKPLPATPMPSPVKPLSQSASA